MNQLVPIAASGTLAAAGECAQERFIESGFKSCLSAFGPPPGASRCRCRRGPRFRLPAVGRHLYCADCGGSA